MGLNRPAITFTLKVLWKGWAQGFNIYEKITFALKELWKGWVLGLKIFDVEVVGERTCNINVASKFSHAITYPLRVGLPERDVMLAGCRRWFVSQGHLELQKEDYIT